MSETMNADPVHRGVSLIHKRRGEQIRIADGPGLVCVIQTALRACENVARREIHRGRPKEMVAVIPPEQRVLLAGLVIPAGDILSLVDLSSQSEGGVAAWRIRFGQQIRQLE